MTMLTAMGGLLARHPDGWRWRDGRAEPRVRDLTAAEAFQFPRVTYPHPDDTSGARLRYVAVPLASAAVEPDLAEVIALAGRRARRPVGDPVVEVPEDVWDPWIAGRVVGVIWDAADEDGLLATAEALGGRPLR